jgi:hypothetical protein
MLKKLHYLLVPLSIIVAFLVLFISLQSANLRNLDANSNFKKRRFYLEKEILPDHSFYPILMIVDRLRLNLADQERQPYLEAAYANRRFFYATRLLEKGEVSLATTTYSKAQKYLLQSLSATIALLESADQFKLAQRQELAFFVLENSEIGMSLFYDNRDQLDAEGKVVLDPLEKEILVLQEKLEKKLFDI